MKGPTSAPTRPLAGLVLAAGRSRRMGDETNKLLEVVGGAPLVRWPIDALLEAGVDPVLVVLGHQASRVRALLADRDVRFVEHDDWARGMAGSIARGARELERLGADCEGLAIVLGDLPSLRASHVLPLVEAFASAPSGAICLPVHGGRRGHPVLFDRRYLGELAALHGEGGASRVLHRHADRVLEVEVSSDGVLADVDTPEDLARAQRRAGPGVAGGAGSAGDAGSRSRTGSETDSP